MVTPVDKKEKHESKYQDKLAARRREFGSGPLHQSSAESGNAWDKSPLFIQGTLYGVTNGAHGVIQIGCERHTFKEWLKNGKDIAKQHGFTDAQIKEYKAIVKFVVSIGK